MRHRLWSIIGFTLLATVTSLYLPVRPAAACDCATAPDDELIEMADVVFTGRLVDRRDPGMLQGGSSADFSTLRFEVDAVYKGGAVIDQVMVTEQSGGSCGLGTIGPGPHLVFGTRSHWQQQVPEGALYAGMCNGTRSVADQPVPASFGPARPPLAPIDGAAPSTTAPALGDDDSAYRYLVGGLVAVVAAAGVSIVFARRRRQAGQVPRG